MKAKHYIIALASLSLSMAVSSCQDFLDTQPLGEELSENFFATSDGAVQATNAIYNQLRDFSVHTFSFIGIASVASDDADKGSTPGDAPAMGELDNFTATAANGLLDGFWQGHYLGIARANQVILRVPDIAMDDALKARLIAEARFLRGYFYFNLVRFFGGVPLLNGVPAAADANNPALQTRASVADTYTFLINDLQFAIDNLPEKGATTLGRVTKGAAQAMLAKVYLYQRNYQRAYDLSQAVITGAKYQLYPTYADIWRTVGNNNSESVFEVQTGVNAACNNSAVNLYSVSQGPRQGGRGGWSDLGFGFNTPTSDLANAYEANDVRRAGTIIFINNTAPAGQRSVGTVLWDGFRIPSKDSVENQRYSYKAYHSRTREPNCGNNDYLPKNIRVMRYAEVLLINAEAAFQLGNTAAATTALTAIRTRAGLPAVAPTLARIWQEHRVELALEHDRFFDLVRQEVVQPGRIVPIFTAQGKTFTKGKNEIFPIPQAQIDLSGGALTQNPGY